MILFQQFLRRMRNVRVFMRTKQWIKLLIFVVLFILFGTVGFYIAESPNHPEYTLADGLWWAMVTMTTVGYGDYYPETPIGRFFVALPAMVAGGGVIAYTISIVASYLVEVKNREMRGMNQLDLTDHVVLVNFPGALKVADMVSELHADKTRADVPMVLLTGTIDTIPEQLALMDVLFVQGSPINEDALAKACVKDAANCIVFAQDDRDENSDSFNLGVLVGLRATGTKANIVAECVSPSHRQLMRKAGADAVICVGELSTMLLAQASQGEQMQELIEDLASNRTPQQIDALELTERAASDTFGELTTRLSDQRVLPIGVQRGGKHFVNPGNDFRLQAGDRLIVITGKRGIRL